MSLEQQLHRAWLTDSVLCSAAREGGPVVTPIARECRVRYLEAQLRLFPNALVVALGGKAQRRLQGWPGIHPAYSVAPPGCNRRQARPSWHAIAEKLLSTRGHR
jgi:uracil-DNA glycosylase